MPETQTVETMYGQVEIETVECDSCGTTVARDDAHPFRIGDGGGIREGYACPVCAEEGPAGFPERVRGWALPAEQTQNGTLGLAFYVTIAPIALVLETMTAFTHDSDQFANGYAIAVMSIAVWGLAFGALAYYGGVF